jgi:hypothetical protein
MKLKGYFRRDGHCYFDAFLVSDKLRKPEFLRLLLDTGTSTTTILDGDCERMGLDCTKLPRNKRDTMAVRCNGDFISTTRRRIRILG